MKIVIENSTKNFESYRAQRVKSLFNAEDGSSFKTEVNIDIDNMDWGIGLIVGASGSGKTSIGKHFFETNKIQDLYQGWDCSKPIVDCILPDGDFDKATGALAAVGLGDVPSWLRPFNALSNGQQFRAGLARLVTEAGTQILIVRLSIPTDQFQP